MNRRICKKKGLLKDQRYQELKKKIFKNIERNAQALEQGQKIVN